jgi:hypothetical protein
VRPDQEEQRGRGEQDKDPQLVVRDRHVREQDQPEHDHRIERASMAEDGVPRKHAGAPHQPTEDERVMGRLAREGLAGNRELEPDPPNGLERCRHACVQARRIPADAVPERDAADDQRQEDTREQRADEVGSPAAPAHLRADDPERQPDDAEPREEAGVSRGIRRPARVLEREADREQHDRRGQQAEPALDRAARQRPDRVREGAVVEGAGLRGHDARASASGVVGPTR